MVMPGDTAQPGFSGNAAQLGQLIAVTRGALFLWGSQEQSCHNQSFAGRKHRQTQPGQGTTREGQQMCQVASVANVNVQYGAEVQVLHL